MAVRCRRWDSFRVWFVVFCPNWNHSMFENLPSPRWSNSTGWTRDQHSPWRRFDGNQSMFSSRCPDWLGRTTSYDSGYWWRNDIGPVLASKANFGVEGTNFHDEGDSILVVKSIRNKHNFQLYIQHSHITKYIPSLIICPSKVLIEMSFYCGWFCSCSCSLKHWIFEGLFWKTICIPKGEMVYANNPFLHCQFFLKLSFRDNLLPRPKLYVFHYFFLKSHNNIHIDPTHFISIFKGKFSSLFYV